MPGAFRSVYHQPPTLLNTGRSKNRISSSQLSSLIFAFVQCLNNLRHFVNPLLHNLPYYIRKPALNPLFANRAKAPKDKLPGGSFLGAISGYLFSMNNSPQVAVQCRPHPRRSPGRHLPGADSTSHLSRSFGKAERIRSQEANQSGQRQGGTHNRGGGQAVGVTARWQPHHLER